MYLSTLYPRPLDPFPFPTSLPSTQVVYYETLYDPVRRARLFTPHTPHPLTHYACSHPHDCVHALARCVLLDDTARQLDAEGHLLCQPETITCTKAVLKSAAAQIKAGRPLLQVASLCQSAKPSCSSTHRTI